MIHSSHLDQIVVNELKMAKREIKAAVCWFTNETIFEVILDKAKQGLDIEIIINYDNINIKEGGLGFDKLQSLGVKCWGYTGKDILHHKYLVIDSEKLIVGSFNWTKAKNRDSLVCLSDIEMAQKLINEMQEAKTQSRPLSELGENDLRRMTFSLLFKPLQWNVNDLRGLLLRKSNLWLVDIGKRCWASWEISLDKQLLALPSIVSKNRKAESPMVIKLVKRIQCGDILVAVLKGKAIGVGVVMDEAFFDNHMGHQRSIEWKCCQENVVNLEVKGGGISKWRESGLRLLSELFMAND